MSCAAARCGVLLKGNRPANVAAGGQHPRRWEGGLEAAARHPAPSVLLEFHSRNPSLPGPPRVKLGQK